MDAMKRVQILIMALSEDETIRDAQSAFKLADQMHQKKNYPVNLELSAIAVAATGDFENAIKKMRAALTKEKQYKSSANVRRMEGNLSLLEKGELPVLNWQDEIRYMAPPPTNALATFRDYPDPNPI